LLLDTSVIIEISSHSGNSDTVRDVLKFIPEDEILFVSILQLSEIADWCMRNKFSVDEEMIMVKEFADVAYLDENICKEAARIKMKRRSEGDSGFGLIDGIILATARSIGQRLLTLDRDFGGEDDCIILERNRGRDK